MLLQKVMEVKKAERKANSIPFAPSLSHWMEFEIEKQERMDFDSITPQAQSILAFMEFYKTKAHCLWQTSD